MLAASGSCSRRASASVTANASAAAAKKTVNRFHASPSQIGERAPTASISNPQPMGARPSVTLPMVE